MEVNLHYLKKKLKPQLKNPETRGTAFKKLMGISPENLEIDAVMELWHLKARYHFYMYKEYEHMEDLRMAIDYAQQVFDAAREAGEQVKDPRYYYSRLYLKYLLMLQIEDEALQQSMHSKLSYYVDKALYHYSENSSFIWLKAQL